MSDPKPSVPLSGGFYAGRVDAAEASRIHEQERARGEVGAANPRRTVLDDNSTAVPVNAPVRLPEALVRHVGTLMREAMGARTGPLNADSEAAVVEVMDKLRTVDVTHLPSLS